MHVVQIHVSPSLLGGSERSLQLSIRGMKSCDVASTLICASAPDQTELDGAERLIVAPEVFDAEPRSPWELAKGKRSLLRTLEALKPDVIHVRVGLRPEYLDAVSVRWPTVYSAHLPICPNGARFHYRTEAICERAVGLGCVTGGYRHDGCGHLSTGEIVTLPAFARGFWTAKHLLRALRQCRFVVASSRWQKRMLMMNGLETEKVVVLPPPIQALSDPHIETLAPPMVAFLGRLVVLKGAEHLLRASAIIPTDHQLCIIGVGPELTRLTQLSKDLGLEDRIQFISGLEPEAALEFVANAQVVAVPSLWPETSNQVGAQAAALGRWVVVYDGGGIRDWAERYPNVIRVSHGQWGEMATQIERVLQIPSPKLPSTQLPFTTRDHVEGLVRLYERASATAAGG